MESMMLMKNKINSWKYGLLLGVGGLGSDIIITAL